MNVRLSHAPGGNSHNRLVNGTRAVTLLACAVLSVSACTSAESGNPKLDPSDSASASGTPAQSSSAVPSQTSSGGEPSATANPSQPDPTPTVTQTGMLPPSSGTATGEPMPGVSVSATSSGSSSGGAAGQAGAGGTAAPSASASGEPGPMNTGGAGGGVEPPSVDDAVTRTDSTFTFQHFPIEANSDFVWSGAATPAAEPTSTTYDTIILENGYLKVTLLPSYGGRVLSIVHKPTNRELLYQNPIGTPYLMGEDIFYYDYLVIMGGIFPSFPEPEHGKYWNQPYTFEIVSESQEAITVRMSRQDDLELAAGVPERYIVGRTDVRVDVEVTLRAGRSNLELATKLTNTRDEAVPQFEYWTVTTLAPGSTPGDTKIPLNTQILAQMDRVHLLESSWAWFGEAEERVSDEIFVWDNLQDFNNWTDQGTAFANPNYQNNWSGLLNKDSSNAVLRISENVETPGLKLWTFGKQSLDIDVNDGAEWLRPTIEMWHGVTPEFWMRGSLAAGAVKSWSDNYFLTLGLDAITAASEYGAVQLSSTVNGTDRMLEVTASLTIPDQTVTVVCKVDDQVVKEQELVAAASEATTLSVSVPSADAPAGAVFAVEFKQGATALLAGQIAL